MQWTGETVEGSILLGWLKGAWTECMDLTLLWDSLTWWCRASSGLGFSQSSVPDGSEPAWCSSSTSTRLPQAVPKFRIGHTSYIFKHMRVLNCKISSLHGSTICPSACQVFR